MTSAAWQRHERVMLRLMAGFSDYRVKRIVPMTNPIDAACAAGLKAALHAPGLYRVEIKAAVSAYLASAAVVDFSKLYTHPLAKQFHEVVQTVDGLDCDSTAAIDQLHALAKAVEGEINRLSASPHGEVTDDMLNEGQERMCQMASRTVFEDHIQAEVYKAMRAVDPAWKQIDSTR